MEALHLKYRPATFDEVLGQKEIITSLKREMKDKKHHAYIFAGKYGTGKTTLGRLIASEVGCSPTGIIEIDGGMLNGIDAMRQLNNTITYKSFGDSPLKVIIIDEAHALTAAAWRGLLKNVEEPPSHVYWIFCTTEKSKIPSAIQSRCLSYNLKDVKKDEILDLFEEICELEGIKLDNKILKYIAKASDGSVRKALTDLAICREAKTVEEVATLIDEADEKDNRHVKEEKKR